MSRQRPVPGRDSSTRRAGMGRLVDIAVDDLVEREAESLARRMVDRDSDEAETVSTDRPEEALSTLQDILFGTDRDRIQMLAADVDKLRHQVSDKQALAAAVAPVLGDAIRRQIQESREEIIDALYPVIGQIVMRAVTEAMRDLARSIDERLQAATDMQRMGRRIRSIFTGVPVDALTLRDGMPFTVQEVYLIHRENGLLLWHDSRMQETGSQESGSQETVSDSDLIGGMLTAIREFVEQVLGGDNAQLHQLQIGNRELILEFGRYAYVAFLIDGVVPSDFRWKVHERVYAFEEQHKQHLRDYDGDASPLQEAARREFEPLLSVSAEVSH